MGTEYRKSGSIDCNTQKKLTDLFSGGSEDVMLDLMIRQLAKNYQQKTRELEKSGGSKL